MSDSHTAALDRTRRVHTSEASAAVSSRDKEVADYPQHKALYQRAKSRSIPNHRTTESELSASPDRTKTPQEREDGHPSQLTNHSVDDEGQDVPVSSSDEPSVEDLYANGNRNSADRITDLNHLRGSPHNERPAVPESHA